MAWWDFEINLQPTEEQKIGRRAVLDRYGRYAFASAFAPIVIILLCRLALWTSSSKKEASYVAVPASRLAKSRHGRSRRGYLAQLGQKTGWWLSEPIMIFGLRCGLRDEWVFGVVWGFWLGVLCVLESGHDFLHLTKRFGIIGVSQLPIQHILALKVINPYAAAFRTSHEDVNRFHRVLGRLIFCLLWLHLVFYINFFIAADKFPARILEPDVFAGLFAFTMYHVLYGTSMTVVRQWSYRVFFITHLFVVFVTPGMIFIHAKPTRPYILSSIALFVVDLVVRKLTTSTASATVEIVPGTNLVKISAALPEKKILTLGDRPGSHVYLSIPWGARPKLSLSSPFPILFEFLFNPFTVADVDHVNGELVLVARHMGGPLTSRLLQLGDGNPNESFTGRVPLSIEGPYGVIAKRVPSLAAGGVDRVLLVAGGIGATFAFPIYKALKASDPDAAVELVWVVRNPSEVSWALSGSSAHPESASCILDDPSVHVFVTGKSLNSAGSYTSENGGRASRSSSADIPLSDMAGSKELSRAERQLQTRKRPNLKQFVDETFKSGDEAERVAVLVCGPEEMGLRMREYVGAWVSKGRDVFWHNEYFGW
ncbi:hypothetical protein jhhlp_002972 [Lomentospora prolificans]|uniref:FAD-binding FR-type domain-containing protein n=1 Tax=Lomentospora prolificans TaxID=41688 RepID=A0A2N3NFN2_9PEZI|nr:hypothetical protein jhhlp_002972 [Lomentospora prolificans]